jgi:hypothetical protein
VRFLAQKDFSSGKISDDFTTVSRLVLESSNYALGFLGNAQANRIHLHWQVRAMESFWSIASHQDSHRGHLARRQPGGD